MSGDKKLVFVYNGDSGLINGLMHYLHKRISPETYPCQLCGLIYDGLSQWPEWVAFVQSLDVPSEFLHRDEYRKRYGECSLAWPAVLLHEGARRSAVVLGAEDFAAIRSLDERELQLQAFVGSWEFRCQGMSGSAA